MGRPKGVKSNYTLRTAQEKYDIIKPIINGEISAKQLAKNLGFSSNGILIKWIRLYQEGGIKALEFYKNKLLRVIINDLVLFLI